MIESLTEIREQIDTLQKKYHQVAGKEFAAQSSVLFGKYPELLSFGWTQYTPYFNDGDTCEFSANTSDVSINGYDLYGGSEGGEGENLHETGNPKKWNGSDWVPKTEYSKRAEEIVAAVKNFLAQFTEDYFRDAFGDHKKILVKRDGVAVDEYDHE